jgi:hypothetical protein
MSAVDLLHLSDFFEARYAGSLNYLDQVGIKDKVLGVGLYGPHCHVKTEATRLGIR